MARLYPPITEEALPAFCLIYTNQGKKQSATLKINFNLNKAVAGKEVSGMVLRLRTVSTNKYVIDENIKENLELGQSEGYAISYDLREGNCVFSLTNKYNPERMEYIKVGQYYKVQIAFVDQNNIIGYWSTVATIKCIARPSATIGNFQDDDVNVFMNEFVGHYKQDTTTGDSSEKAYSYRFQLFDTDRETILEDTGILLHNSENDTKSNESQDKYYCFRELLQDQIYYLQYSVITINGYETVSPLYQIINVGSINPIENIGLLASLGNEEYYSSNSEWLPREEGLVKLQIIFNSKGERDSRKKLMGNFVITRSSSKDNFTTWQEVARRRFNEDIPQLKVIYDYTVEQGVKYKYAVQQYNHYGFYSNKIYCYERDSNLNIITKDNLPVVREVIADFEDMFLYDGKKQLKIRFNPKINSFKNDLQEQKIDTIGSKYPFIFRNGNVCYKEFPISGLISFQQDNALFFMDENDFSQMDLDRFQIPEDYPQIRYSEIYSYEPIDNNVFLTQEMLPLYYQLIKEEPVTLNQSHENLNSIGVNNTEEIIQYIKITDLNEARTKRAGEGYTLYKKISKAISPNETATENFPDIYRGQTYNKNDLTGENIASERYFKLNILDWLTDGKLKLFRSPTEGNYVVRLMNTSLTPKNELGRMLHEFSCTAYEIAGTDFFTLKELGLLNIDSDFAEEYQWNSINVRDIFIPQNFDVATNSYNVDLNNKKVYGFSCTGFEPGDIVSFITDKTSEPLDITIGQAGSYLYDGPDTIISLKVIPFYNKGPFSRDIQLKTKGFNYQKFDLITDIGIHTQIGQQLVGKHDNIFKKIIVGDSGYQSSNNTYLIEDFKQVPKNQIILENFQQNIGKWYLKEDNNYRLTKSNDVFSSDLIYYTRIPAGEKIFTYELIHLHAKRREIIPIFMNKSSGTAGYRLDQANLGRPIFSLTPYGNGYVHYRSVSQEENFKTLYGILTQEEREHAWAVNDLIDFLITACHKDIFCLFEVYIPFYNAATNTTDWGPYGNGNFPFTSYSGIFDPYLASLGKRGWWERTELYDPTFSLTYFIDQGRKEKEFNRVVSLQDIEEITIQNTLTPLDLSTGNGIVTELIYRLKFINYSMEKEEGSEKVYNAKNNYLKEKQNALSKMAQYRSENYYREAYSVLMEKYGQEAVRLDKIENYSTIILDLIKKAFNDQKTQIPKKYLTNEEIMVNQLTIDLRRINQKLFSLSEAFEFFLYGQEIENKKNLYDEYVKSNKNNIIEWYDLDYYLTNNYLIEDILRDINQKVDPIVYHMTNNNNQDLFSTLNSMLNFCNNQYNSKSQELANLPAGVSYVAQYQEDLEKRKRKNFFNNKVMAFDIEYPIGYWLHKSTLTEQEFDELKDNSAINLEDYFHVGEDDKLFPELGEVALKREIIDDQETISGYWIDGLEDYIGEDSLIKNSAFYSVKIPNTNIKVISYLIEQLEELNNNMSGVFNVQGYEEFYGIKYSSTVSESLQNLILDAKNNKLALGLVPNDINSTVPKNKLEETVDIGFQQGSPLVLEEYSFELLEQYLNNYCDYYKELPLFLRTQLINIIMKYTSKDNEEQKSFRQHYSETITYIKYSVEHLKDFTQDEKNYILNKISEYQNRRNGPEWANTNIDNNINTFSQNLLTWNSIRNNLNGTIESALVDEMNEYITELNTIIKEKNNVISQYFNFTSKINELNKLSPSMNIREQLEKEIKIYAEEKDELTELKQNFEKKLSILQEQGKVIAYQDFLKDYFALIQSNDRFRSDNTYANKIQALKKYVNTSFHEIQDFQREQNKVKNAWGAFLLALAEDYKKMR